MRKEAQRIDDDRVVWAWAARSRLINQQHVKADGNRRILATRVVLERPEQ